MVRLCADHAQGRVAELNPAPEMLLRQPGIPRFMKVGPDKPLGPGALYLYRNGRGLLTVLRPGPSSS